MILKTAILGALLSLDSTAVGQFMFSRPIVAGALTGWLWGDAVTGLFVGLLVEFVWIQVVPVGGAVPPNSGVTAILATVWSLSHQGFSPLVVALALAVPFGYLLRHIDILVHKGLRRITEPLLRKVELGEKISLGPTVLGGLLIWFLRGLLFYLLVIPTGINILEWTKEFWAKTPTQRIGNSIFFVALLGLAVTVDHFLSPLWRMKKNRKGHPPSDLRGVVH